CDPCCASTTTRLQLKYLPMWGRLRGEQVAAAPQTSRLSAQEGGVNFDGCPQRLSKPALPLGKRFLERPHSHLAEGDGAVIHLQVERRAGHLGERVHRIAGGRVHFHVLMHDLAVEHHRDEPSVLDFVALMVEAWRPKDDAESLPFA